MVNDHHLSSLIIMCHHCTYHHNLELLPKPQWRLFYSVRSSLSPFLSRTFRGVRFCFRGIHVSEIHFLELSWKTPEKNPVCCLVKRILNMCCHMFPPNPGFAHTQTIHPSNMIYYDILITRGWMETLAIRSDFDFKFSGFRVLIFRYFWVLGF